LLFISSLPQVSRVSFLPDFSSPSDPTCLSWLNMKRMSYVFRGFLDGVILSRILRFLFPLPPPHPPRFSPLQPLPVIVTVRPSILSPRSNDSTNHPQLDLHIPTSPPWLSASDIPDIPQSVALRVLPVPFDTLSSQGFLIIQVLARHL